LNLIVAQVYISGGKKKSGIVFRWACCRIVYCSSWTPPLAGAGGRRPPLKEAELRSAAPPEAGAYRKGSWVSGRPVRRS